MKKMKKTNFLVGIKKKIIMVAVLSFIITFALAWRLTDISMFNEDVKSNLDISDQKTEKNIFSKRGQILDRHGVILAESVDAFSLCVNPQTLKDPEIFAAQVGSIIGVPEKTIVEIIKNNKHRFHAYIKRKISSAQREDILKIRKPWNDDFSFEEDQRREYPKIQTAASVIGYVGTDNYGLSGLEFAYEDKLNGIQGKRMQYHTFIGDRVPRSSDLIQRPVPGLSVVTTLDYTLQNIVEGILDKHIHRWDAKGGVAIIMDPRSGEILSMANKPSFDLNFGQNFIHHPDYLNKAVSLNYEPGSVFKTFIAAMALEEGIITPMTLHQCSGRVVVADRAMECMIAHGEQNLSDILRNSCNISFVGIGIKLRDNMYRYARRFNFGATLPLEIYGQERGIVSHPDTWHDTTVATFSFGQGISATPMQLAVAYSSLANDGKMMKPLIVRETRDHMGNTLEVFEPKVIRSVVSAQTAREVKVALKNSVHDPRGISQAYIPGMSIGGKTGTAKKVFDGKYSDDKVITSFVGFFPVEDPQYVILVSIDEPKPSYEAYGSTVAAPIFREIVQWIQSHMLLTQ